MFARYWRYGFAARRTRGICDIISCMADYTLDANECPGAVKKPGFSVKRCLLLLFVVLAGAFAYWRYGIDRPENVIIELLERYHNSSSDEEFLRQPIETTMGTVSPLMVVDVYSQWSLRRVRGSQGAIVFAKSVIVDGDKATVIVCATKGAYSLPDRLAMRWLGIEGRVPKGGADSWNNQVYHVAKVNGKWLPVVTDADVERVCARSRLVLAAAAEQWRMVRGVRRKQGEPVETPDIKKVLAENLLKFEPKCPDGGTYSIEADPDPSKYTCTVKCSKHSSR